VVVDGGATAPLFKLIDGVLADGWAVGRGGIREGVYCAWATAAKIVAVITNMQIVVCFMSSLLVESNF